MKRSKAPARWIFHRHGRKSRRMVDKFDCSRSPNSSGDVSEEQFIASRKEEQEVGEEEQVVYKEPSMHYNLLKTSRSGSKSLADAHDGRQIEEGITSDADNDVDGDGGSKCLSVSEEDIDGEEVLGIANEPHRRQDIESKPDYSSVVGLMEESEDAGIKDEDEAFDTDQEHDLGINCQSGVEKPINMSSFDIHLGHTLSKEEAEDLPNRKWKYEWGIPAVGMSNCKWIGTGECYLKDVNDANYDLKLSLYKHWLEVYETSGGQEFDSSVSKFFFSLCNGYRDILHCNKRPFYLKGPDEDSCIMDAYIIHSLNHVFRTRDLVKRKVAKQNGVKLAKKNNAKVTKGNNANVAKQNDAKAAKQNDAKVANQRQIANLETLTSDAFLDRGFTRPKVLILLPLASIALRVVKRLIQLTPSEHKVNVEHFDRFFDEFGTGVEENEDKNELSEKLHDLEKSKSRKSSKPSDFQALFGGNNDDHFMICIKFTKKGIKLVKPKDIHISDLIIASPLGLITKIGEAEVDKEKDVGCLTSIEKIGEAEVHKPKDVDYLSSIEVLVIDHADVISMQNWSHVNAVVEQLNRTPSERLKSNIMRIREWYLEGHARFYRQTIILGSYLNPDINASFNQQCVNFQGKVKLVCEYKGVLPKVLLQARQIYERFNSQSIRDIDDDRLEYFTKEVFPKIKDSVQGGTMLFISSYFEFVRIRNYMKSQNASFCLLGEYTKQSDISRARVMFFEGRRKIMLYTERAHFYHRYKIRGIQNLIIYSLPERKEFYPEIVNMLEGSHNMTCTVLFSRFDLLRLERIVGTGCAKRMVTSDRGAFVFC